LQLASLKSFIENPENWDQYEKRNSIFKQIKELSGIVEPYGRIQNDIEALIEFSNIGETEDNLLYEYERIKTEFDKLNTKPIPKSIFLTIKAGNGGHEACDWVSMLLRMYYLYAKKNGLQAELLDSDPYEPSGLRSVVISIKGENVFNFFSMETGVHRLSRVSPFDQADRRQTSRALVVIEPEVTEKAIEISEKDMEITTCCGSGPGGQNTNKVETVVMIKHVPTGLRVRCQAERSQEANKKIALNMIATKVVALQQQQKDKKEADKRAKLPKADFGERSRTYVLSQHPQVIDHRTGKKTANVKAVLEGDLEIVL